MVPAFQSVAKSGNEVVLSWKSLAGLTYQVQYSTSLTGTNWIGLTNGIPGIHGATSFKDTSASGSRRFYRVVLLP
jgi:hypothetical protein